ncbi:hypothetical protein [Paenibacillus glycanilyticus]|uniref:hypothetical protein n=1 Tax=Paenibacillus glycanilyticus TaxID=126569 RepID=UPI0024E15CFF|nr:hypothetical protein [Paenibacillus glycanilyticus]
MAIGRTFDAQHAIKKRAGFNLLGIAAVSLRAGRKVSALFELWLMARAEHQMIL